MTIDGAVGVCLVDWDSGMSLGALGGGKYLDLDVAAAGNTEVIRAKMRTTESLRLDDAIEDILITLGKQYHLIRPLKNSRDEQGLFLFLVPEPQKASPAGRDDIMTAPLTANGSLTSTPTSTATWPAVGKSR